MKRALDTVHDRIRSAVQKRPTDIAAAAKLPRLIAVSKLKPISAIIEAYNYGQRYFGENYIQELETKSNSEEILTNCPEIKFHFIGHLQSNKVNKLLKVRNLHMIETVDSIKLANLINKAIDKHMSGEKTKSSGDEGQDQINPNPRCYLNDRLKVLIQVNTSGEEQKNGIEPEKAPELADHITKQCQWLQLAGIMTIGRLDGWEGDGPNQDFLRLFEVREKIAKHLSVEAKDLELSMGMSSDFEEAIVMGSTNIRVGTMIFGERPPKQT